MASEGFKRKLTSIFSADVVGYSRLMREDEEATVQTLIFYRATISDLILKHGGRVVDSPGDNILAEFSSVLDAVNCSIVIQRELSKTNAELSENRKMLFRIGLNIGDVIEEGERIYGDGINIAARLEGLAENGSICISGNVYDEVKNKLSLAYESLGKCNVKNINDPIRVYRIVLTTKSITSELSKNLDLPENPSIAVLPFDNMSGDPHQDYIGDGLTENIITALSKISDLVVIARNSVYTYKNRPVKVQQVSHELGVKYVLEGSVQKASDRIRITAQLIDATTGDHLWAEQYDRELKDFFDMLDEITLKIAVSLQGELTEGMQARVRHRSTNNLRAWRYAVKGSGFFERFTKEGNTHARELFERAIEIDSGYVWALALLAWTYWAEARYGWSASPADSLNRCVDIVNKAVKLDDPLSEIYSVMGATHLFKRQYDEAIAEGRKSIALAPGNAYIYAILAHSMWSAGMSGEAIALSKKAMRLHPFYPAWYLSLLGHSYTMAERYEEAIDAFQQLHERSKKGEFNLTWSHCFLAVAYMSLGRKEEAHGHVAKVNRLDPGFSYIEYVRNASLFKDLNYLERRIDHAKKTGLK